MKTYTKYLGALLVVIIALSSCRRDEDYSSWDTGVLTPIANTSLTIKDLLKDSSVRQNPDSSLQLVFEQELYTADVKDFFIVPDTELKTTLTLEKLELSDKTINESITLGDIYPASKLLNGQSLAIPAQNITSIPATPIDGSELFQTAVLKEGYMDVSLHNGFPVTIEEVEFNLINKVTGNILVVSKMTNILPGESKSVTTDLAGKQVDASMEIKVISLKTYATSNPVLINSNDKVDIVINVRGLRPLSATAVFPSQSVYTRDENELYYFKGAEVKKMRLKTGKLRLHIVSTIQENMTVNYSIPHAVKNGASVHEVMKVPPAPPGGSSDVFRDIPLDGYTIDMRGKNPTVDDLVNSFWNIRDVTLDSSGKINSISLNDSIYIYFGLIDMTPEWAEGYFAQQNLTTGKNTLDFDFFNGSGGSIDFDKIKLNLDITNGIGADARINIKSISSLNSRTGTSVPLNATPLSSPISIAPATDNPFTISRINFDIDENNSNIKAFIKNLPDKIEYDMDVSTNPNGNVRLWKDFIYDYSKLVAKLQVSMPLSFTASNLSLTDTLPFEMFSTGNLTRVKEGTFNIIVDNSFPLSANVQMYILDGSGAITDSVMLQQHNLVLAGDIDLNTGKVVTSKRSVLKAYFSPQRMLELKYARRILMKATFNTPVGNTTPVKIYSNYKFDIKLTGDFVYEQRF